MIVIQSIIICVLLGLITFAIYMIKYKAVEKSHKYNKMFISFNKSHHAGTTTMLMISVIPIIGVLINVWGLIELFLIK